MTHALTEDNERGIATGRLPGRLSERGRADAAGLAAVFSSALRPPPVAFGDTGTPDPVRLAAARVRLRRPQRLPGGPAWTSANAPIRAARATVRRSPGRAGSSPTGQLVMLIGHLATYRALQRATTGRSVPELVAAEPEGWEYRL